MTPVASEVVEAAVAATQTAFEELCQTALVPGEPSLARWVEIPECVTAEIGLRRAIPGRLVLAFPQAVLESLANRYLPEGEPRTAELMEDAAGEFANVIAGQMKTILKGTRYHFNLSTPRVGLITGADGDFLAQAFECDAGSFALYAQLSPCDE